MGRIHAPLFSLNQGEVSKLALGRVDVAKLRLAASCQVNWMPWTLGPAMLRPGLIHIGEVLADAPGRLIRFVFSKLDVALLELTANVMRVWVGEALVTRAAVSTTISNSTFQSGGTGWVTTGTTSGATATANTGSGILSTVPVGGLARLQQTVTVALADRNVEHALRVVLANGPVTLRIGSTAGNDNLIEQTVLDSGTHSLAFTPTTASFVLQIESVDARQKKITSVQIESAGVLTLPTIWGSDDIANVRYDQSGDIIFVACYGLQQQKIERRGETSWSVVVYRSDDGPFQAQPTADANFAVDVFTGNGNLTSDRPYFEATHVGVLFRMFVMGQVYGTMLGAGNAFTPAVRISGVGDTRTFNWEAEGTYSGILTWQRSFDGPDSGFVDVAQGTDGQTGGFFASDTGGISGTPDLDNIIAWERVGFKAGDYTSGSVLVNSGYFGDGGFAIVRATGFVSPTHMTVEVLAELPTFSPTSDWVQQDWSQSDGYPSSVAFFDGRLFWFGRDQFWGSQSNDYVSFADQDIDGNPAGDAGALNEQFGSGPVDTVSWGVGALRLLAGREGSIASIRASSFDEVLTPSNISSKDCTTQGAARLPAVKIDTSVVYVQQSGRRVYELVFNPQALDYVAIDLTRLNLDIGKPGFVDLDGQRQPDTNLHLVRTDGHVAVLLHEREDEVDCWWRIQTAGVIENVAVLPDAGIEDLVYYIVRRTVNGVTRRFIERLAHRDSCVGAALNVQADCCLTYVGSPVSSVSLPWLPSTQVVVWADGAALGTTTTDGSGNCAMPDGLTHSSIAVGLGGDVIVGSTSTTLSNGNAPDQVFSDNSNTLTVPSRYEGCPCEVFADPGGTGKPVHLGTINVSGGLVTLPNGWVASSITACLGYVAPYQSAKLAYAAQLGSALTQKKKIDHVGLVLFDAHSDGLQFGQRFDKLDPMPSVVGGLTIPAGTVWPEFDEPMIPLNGQWNTDARLCLLAQAPKPCTIGGIVVGMETVEKS